MNNIKPVPRRYFSQYVTVLVGLTCAPLLYAENFPAILQWSKRVELSTPVSGVIKTVSAEPGQKVDKGVVLVQLDDEVFKARVQATQATFHNQVEQHKEAERELKRAKELYDRTLLSEHDLQVAKNNESNARAELEKVRAAMVQAKQNLAYSSLRAPFNALVLARAAEPGKVISADLKPETLVTVAASDQMIARIWVNDTKVTSLHNGMTAKVRVNDQEIPGTVKSIAYEPDAKTTDSARYAVDVEFLTANLTLRAGQQASVSLP